MQRGKNLWPTNLYILYLLSLVGEAITIVPECPCIGMPRNVRHEPLFLGPFLRLLFVVSNPERWSNVSGQRAGLFLLYYTSNRFPRSNDPLLYSNPPNAQTAIIDLHGPSGAWVTEANEPHTRVLLLLWEIKSSDSDPEILCLLSASIKLEI